MVRISPDRQRAIRNYFVGKTFYDSSGSGYEIFELYFFDEEGWVNSLQAKVEYTAIVMDYNFIFNEEGWVSTYTAVMERIRTIIERYFVNHPHFYFYNRSDSGAKKAKYCRKLIRGRINYDLDRYRYLLPNSNQLNLFYKAFNYKNNPVSYMWDGSPYLL